MSKIKKKDRLVSPTFLRSISVSSKFHATSEVEDVSTEVPSAGVLELHPSVETHALDETLSEAAHQQIFTLFSFFSLGTGARTEAPPGLEPTASDCTLKAHGTCRIPHAISDTHTRYYAAPRVSGAQSQVTARLTCTIVSSTSCPLLIRHTRFTCASSREAGARHLRQMSTSSSLTYDDQLCALPHLGTRTCSCTLSTAARLSGGAQLLAASARSRATPHQAKPCTTLCGMNTRRGQ